MGFSDGGFLLIEKHWIDRTQKLREKYSQKILDTGLKLHDHDRNGEKGFQYIGPGFTTTPEGQAMRGYFKSIGDEQTVALFRDSSMEFVRKLGGDPTGRDVKAPVVTSDADITDVSNMKQAVVEGLATIKQIYVKATETALPHKIRVGKLLAEIKDHPSIKHGDWLPWLKSVGLGHRRAQEFMQLASKETLLKSKCADIAHLTEQAAWEIVRDQTRKPEQEHKKYEPPEFGFETSTTVWRLDTPEVRERDRWWRERTRPCATSWPPGASTVPIRFFSAPAAMCRRPARPTSCCSTSAGS